MRIKTQILAVALLLAANGLQAAPIELTLEKAIELSVTQSPSLLTSELNLERYEMLLNAQRASLKSKFSLTVDPFKYSNSRYMDSRTSEWYTNESMSSSSTFSISQPIMLTGSTISLNNKFGWQNNISAIDGGSTTSSASFTNSLYLTLSQPLFTYNEYKYELLEIEMDYENAKISYAITRMNMEQSIISQFYSLYMSQQNITILEEELDNARQNYDIINEQVSLDMVSRSELFQAELNVLNAESSLENKILSLESSKDQFKQTLGIPLSEDIVAVAEIEDSYVPIDMELAVRNALTNRLELRQREITNANAEISLMTTKDNGSFSGDLSLSIGLMGDDETFGYMYNTPTTSPSVSLSLSIPIFDWGARRSRIKAQELQMDMNEIDEEQELLDIEIEVVQSCRTINNLVRQIEISKSSLKNAQLTYDLNVENYRAGEITGMEMDEFQSQLSSQKLSLAQSMIDYKLELIELKVLSLYDFEKREPISPLLMYGSEAMDSYKKINLKQITK
ncbi:MAG: TolC family protein [Rikenellaceae bacterium]